MRITTGLVLAILAGIGWAEWRDCNLPENAQACEAEFKAKEAQRARDQATMDPSEFCEKYNVCGGGGPGGAGGG